VNYLHDEAYCKAFGKRLGELRKSKGYSMRGLAKEADMEYSQYSKIEKGSINTTICTVYALSQALGIPTNEFFKFSIDKTNPK
jgi:transcriptional regulator with XRE-family HTH domain